MLLFTGESYTFLPSGLENAIYSYPIFIIRFIYFVIRLPCVIATTFITRNLLYYKFYLFRNTVNT